MPKITFIPYRQEEIVVDAEVGSTVMEAAVRNGVPGIEAECGGACACATCHVYVDPAWADRLPPPEPHELEMLDLTAAERRPTSRLSCQIQLGPELQGLVVHVPDRQY